MHPLGRARVSADGLKGLKGLTSLRSLNLEVWVGEGMEYRLLTQQADAMLHVKQATQAADMRRQAHLLLTDKSKVTDQALENLRDIKLLSTLTTLKCGGKLDEVESLDLGGMDVTGYG